MTRSAVRSRLAPPAFGARLALLSEGCHAEAQERRHVGRRKSRFLWRSRKVPKSPKARCARHGPNGHDRLKCLYFSFAWLAAREPFGRATNSFVSVRSFNQPAQRENTFAMRAGSTPSCTIATPPLTDSRYSAISRPFRTNRLVPSITTRRPANSGIFEVKLDSDQA